MAHNSISGEDDAFLSFLDKDVLDSQTTLAVFDSTLFEGLPTDGLKYQDLLHPPSPPTSVGTFSESSGSPQHSNVDSCDEGSGSDVPMEGNPLDYWQYVYSGLNQPANLSLLADQLQQQQPGAWPILPNVDAALLQPSTIPVFTNGTIESSSNNANLSKASPTMASMPPSPASSVKTEKRTKRVKKQASAPAQPAPIVPLVPLAPLKPLMPLAPLAPLAPQPAPLSPPTSVHDVIIKQSPPLSPRILSPSQAAAGATSPLRRPSIVPAPSPNVVRSNVVLVKSTLIPEEKPQSEAAMTAQAKRQERLIKNRAAALLSRKRKREHINLLETHTDLLKTTNQELQDRVSELEESVKTLTIERDTIRDERDSARQECEHLRHQINVLTTHRPQSDALHMDLERNIRSTDSERGLNSKATGVVFMIILFSFALFNLPSGKLETLMVGGSLDRPRLDTRFIGRALDSYTKNPTISGQIRENIANKQDLHNMTDLVVFSDNRALQTWLGHQPASIPKSTSTEGSSSSAIEKEVTRESIPSTVVDENTKSVGFVAQTHEPLTWASPDAPQDMNEPDRDAWLYCSNLMYSLRSSSVSKAAGPAQATNGEFRRPRLSFISPLDGVVGSATTDEKDHLPPWMPNSSSKENNPEQKYLRLDVEVTSSRVVSGKGLGDHEQLIRFPLMPVGIFDNMTTSLAPAKAAAATPVSADNESSSSSPEGRKHFRPVRSSRINGRGGIVKNRRIYDKRDQPTRGNQAAPQTTSASVCTDEPMPFASIKEEPMEIFIKEEPMD